MRKKGIPISIAMILLVCGIVAATLAAALTTYVPVYYDTVTELVTVNSSQAVQQMTRTVESYTMEMREAMGVIREACALDEEQRHSTVENLIRLRSDVEAVYLYDSNAVLLEAWTDGEELKETYLRNLSYMEWSEEVPDDNIYLSSPHVESMLTGHYPWVVSFMQQVEDASGGRMLAVMDIRFSRIAQYVDRVGIGKHGYCFLMDMDGRIVYHPQQQLINAELKYEYADWLAEQPDGDIILNDTVYSLSTLGFGGWRAVGVSFMDELVPVGPDSMAIIVVLVFYSVILAAYAASLLMTYLVTRPVRSLIEAIREFEEDTADFSFQLFHGSSEMLELGESFDHMAKRIQELMEQIRREEVTLQKAELKALQAQINPHFLYNTLDAISWMCEEGRNEDAARMVNALARLFRISISRGQELIPIKKEVEHAESYLMIQQFRYKDQFKYSFDVQESCLDCLCNKITLQPIIENAIYHGIDLMVEEGRIDIRIYEDGGDIVFEVEDNGIGMTEEQCAIILAGLGNKAPGGGSATGGIGIKNVNERIKIYFGKSYGITILSEPDEGTLVTIRIPRTAGESYEGRH